MHALGEPSPLVRAHVAWAIAQIVSRTPPPPAGAAALRALLEAALTRETDADVRLELGTARGALA